MIRWQPVLWVCLFGVFVGLSCAPIGDMDQPPAPPVQPADKPGPVQAADALKERVRAALDRVARRDLLTTHSFWTVFHAILGNGLDTPLRDPLTDKKFSALEFIRKGGKMTGLEFIVKENVIDGQDGLDVRIGPIFDGQGHQDQFVAEMAQLGLPLDTPFFVKHEDKVKEYKFENFVHYSKANARLKGNPEFSWTILVVSQYYGTQLSWTNRFGEKVHFEDLVEYEADQPIESAACGGTHRLFGLTWAYFIHLRDGGKMTPVWQKVSDRLKKYGDLARKDQNKIDGSFSTSYFRGPGNVPSLEMRIGSTGHIVEWLALYLPDEELRQPWMQDAVNALVVMILDSHQRPIDAGAIYHAAHGLHLYYWRVWQADDALPSSKIIPLPPKK